MDRSRRDNIDDSTREYVVSPYTFPEASEASERMVSKCVLLKRLSGARVDRRPKAAPSCFHEVCEKTVAKVTVLSEMVE